MKQLTSLFIWLLFCGVAAAQVQVPEGTRLQVRLEEDLSSATAQEGQAVQLSVVDDVKVGDTVVIASGAAVTGQIVVAVHKGLTSSGKLDFSAEGVMAADGAPIPLRYSQDKKSSGSRATSGLLGAGATVVFGPSLTLLRMMRAKDITLQKGMVVEVFTGESHAFKSPAPASAKAASEPAKATAGSKKDASAPQPVKIVIISITSKPDGAKITVDGTDMGEAPASFQLDPGNHAIQIEKEGFAVWKRTITAKAGTPIDLDVQLAKPSVSKPAPPKPAATKPAGANPVATKPKASGTPSRQKTYPVKTND